MAIVKFEQNGQGFYDFDALLNATSQEFVEYINEYLKLTILDQYSDRYTLKADIREGLTTVYVIEDVGTPCVNIFQYFNDTGIINRSFLSIYDLKMLVGEFNE